MRIRLTVPKEHVNEATLGKALEASTEIAQQQIERGQVPLAADAIDDGLVKWKPEPAEQGFEGFDLPSDALKRGWGDCDDLAPWHAASLRATGEDPDAEAIVYQSGPKRWHAVVQRGNGDIDDPSRWAGMGRPGGPLPITEPIAEGASCVGFASTLSGRTRARWDIPVNRNGEGLAIEQFGADPFDALANVTDGAIALLGFWGAPLEVFLRLHAIAHILDGGSDEDWQREHGISLDDMGDFVSGLSEICGSCVGAHFHPKGAKLYNPNKKPVVTTTFQPDTKAIADIATTIIDPLGIHNLFGGLFGGGAQASFQPPSFQASFTPPSASVNVTGDHMPHHHHAYYEDDAASEQDDFAYGKNLYGKNPWGASDVFGKVPEDDGLNGDSCPDGYKWLLQSGHWLCVPESTQVQGLVPRRRPLVGAAKMTKARYQQLQGRKQQADVAKRIAAMAAMRKSMQMMSSQQQSAYGAPPQYPDDGGYDQPPPPPAYDPYTGAPMIPGTDLAPDEYGGYATPTAFQQYSAEYAASKPVSAFDGTVMMGDPDDEEYGG